MTKPWIIILTVLAIVAIIYASIKFAKGGTTTVITGGDTGTPSNPVNDTITGDGTSLWDWANLIVPSIGTALTDLLGSNNDSNNGNSGDGCADGYTMDSLTGECVPIT